MEDGRLKIGDRLLEVNNIEMTGKSQSEAAAILRNTPPGSKVKIVVSRQEDAAPTENNKVRYHLHNFTCGCYLICVIFLGYR